MTECCSSSSNPPLHDSSLIHFTIESDSDDNLKYPASTLICLPPSHTALSSQFKHSVLLTPSEYEPGEQTTQVSFRSISPDSQYLNDASILA